LSTTVSRPDGWCAGLEAGGAVDELRGAVEERAEVFGFGVVRGIDVRGADGEEWLADVEAVEAGALVRVATESTRPAPPVDAEQPARTAAARATAAIRDRGTHHDRMSAAPAAVRPAH
jgi:hypothetical protein